MAAIYLHNAAYTRDSRDENSEITEHSRNLSTISSATLLTNTTSHSQPNEPLLQPTKSPEATTAYYDHLPHQARPPDGSESQLRWTEPPTPYTDLNTVGEKPRHSREGGRKLWRRRKQIQWSLEIIIAAWAIYNSVRYFLAFNVYGRDAATGQVICLALGTSAGVSFALTFFASVVSVMKHKLLTFGLVFRYLLRICSIMRYLSSFFLFAPAVVNLVFVFLWRDSSNPQFNLHNRCHIDIDVIWASTINSCSNQTRSWALWVLSSFLRLALTFLILSAYHIIAILYPEPPRRPMHHRLRSGSETLYSPQSTPGGERPSLSMLIPHHQDLRAQHHPSDISLDGATLRDDCSPLGRIRLARSRSSGFSGETTHGETQSLGRKPSSSVEPEVKPDQSGYVDRFRSILSQISQEADDAVEYARNEQASSPEKLIASSPALSSQPPSYSQDDYEDESDDEQDIHDQARGRHDNIFNLPLVPPSLGYNEFGLPYPPDQDVRMLNGYIRRMPTIESMGSGEVGTSIGASSARQGGGSLYTSSRPPTRNTLLSFVSTEYDMAGSNPPSRTNSLSARAELLLSPVNGTSEHGELLTRSESAMRRISSQNSFVESPLGSPVVDTYSSSTSGSRGTTMSYHTATTGSSGESFQPASHLDTTPRPARTRDQDHDT